MIAALTLVQEFWAEFYEEKVDLKKIMVISDKLMPHRTIIEEMYKQALAEEKYSSFKILGLYTMYLRQILRR
jgi:hypothetical protein